MDRITCCEKKTFTFCNIYFAVDNKKGKKKKLKDLKNRFINLHKNLISLHFLKTTSVVMLSYYCTLRTCTGYDTSLQFAISEGSYKTVGYTQLFDFELSQQSSTRSSFVSTLVFPFKQDKKNLIHECIHGFFTA